MTVHAPASSYRGRFAPTPSGPLHLGSLMTALASWLEARAHDGVWLLRIDDLDSLRCVAGAEAHIREQLERHGLYWDEMPRYQSAHRGEYLATLDTLRAQNRLYACRCTRAELAASSRPGPDGAVYAGTCRDAQLTGSEHALRFRVDDTTLRFVDGGHGLLTRELHNEVGDFVVQRRDSIFGYHLACTVDERAQRISNVVRGADLIGPTFAQLHLMQALAWPPPRYHHVPVMLDTNGLKLSKQNHARPIDASRAGRNLWDCLNSLQQQPPLALREADPATILGWAQTRWRIAHVGTAAVPTVEPPP